MSRRWSASAILLLILGAGAPRAEAASEPPPPPPAAFALLADGRSLLERARASPPSPERDQLFRRAAEAHRDALRLAPNSDVAPEAVINGAYADKQVGMYGEAIALYQQLLRGYGSDASLDRLSRGDRRRYDERRRYAQLAAEAIAAGELLTFDYAAAAAAYEVLARDRHFEAAHRLDAARNAVMLRAMLGNRDAARADMATLASLSPPAPVLAMAEWMVTRMALATWDERALDTGPNRVARLAALAAVERFASAREVQPETAHLAAEAAHTAARLRRAGGDPQAAVAWCRRALRAFDRAAALHPSPRPPMAEPVERCAGMVEAPSGTPLHRDGMSGTRPGMTLEAGELLAPPVPAAE